MNITEVIVITIYYILVIGLIRTFLKLLSK
jgi:hypothetical protein